MNNQFDTDRFIEISTPRQMQNGTVMFSDTQNPGVYYAAHRNGNINRIVKTRVTTHINANNSTSPYSVTKNMTKYTRINHRQKNNGSFIPLHRLNDQLQRIQNSANNYTNDIISTSTDMNNNIIVTIPR